MKKRFFYAGIIGLILFEIANVYFIMPMPGSQEMNSIDTAYFLHDWRWIFRGLFALSILWGIKRAFNSSIFFSVIFLLIAGGISWMANQEMAADTMFLQPEMVSMKDASANEIDSNRLVLGIEFNGEAKAFPIQFLGYHHQVRDSIGGKPVMVTYCTVCRTGRVFEPVMNGKTESFRLVGMDHFNAMFEDETTGSWWRQATGEAVAGPLKGQFLPEFPATQLSLGQWLRLHPNSLVMQPDPNFQVEYDSMSIYEKGRLTGKLTRYDTASWNDKSWIAGVVSGKESRAFDWNELKKQQVINDVLDSKPIAVVLADDRKSLFAFIRNSTAEPLSIRNDTLFDSRAKYDLQGKSMTDSLPDLKRLQVYQEYWHSWRTFHPNTRR